MAYHNVELMLRREYNEPPSKILMDYAKAGNSKRLTAGSLGINRQTLDRMIRDYGVTFLPQAQQRDCCRPKGAGWIKGRKRKVE